jgi:N-acetylglucosaminyl-diphospho-decaprenol L-rhamnosyltransferase
VQAFSNQPLESAVLSVVIVNYRSWPDILRLVGSLLESPSIGSGTSEVVVVDNASHESIPPQLLGPTNGLRLILQPENGGFSSGVNAGWRASTGRWLLVLNPDIVAGTELIDQVLDRIARYEGTSGPRPGIVGFGLRNPDGSRQPSVGVFPGLVRTVWEQLIPRYRRKYQPEWRLRPGRVDWVTGACMLLDSRMLAELGGMDEDFFLYYEEVALCRSARGRGWGVEYDPSVSVVHLRPLQNRAISPKMRVITRHSKLLYFRKHLPPWQFAALSSVVRLEARVQAAWCRVRSKAEETRSWRAVDRVTKLLASGAELKGRAVLTLAEAVAEPLEDDEEPDKGSRITIALDSPRQTHGRSQRTRTLQPRKDGPE